MKRILSTSVFLLSIAVGTTSGGSFDTSPAGPFNRLATSVGTWSAEDGHARVHSGNARSGGQSLRIHGEGERSVVLGLAAAAEQGAVLAFHAERWTRRDPFEFRIDARSHGEWREIHQADAEVKVGGFDAEFRLPLPVGTREVRFRATAPADAGVLIDDVMILRPGPARATSMETVQPVAPAFIRKSFNPVIGFRIHVEGSEGTTALNAIEIGFGGTLGKSEIESFQIVAGQSNPAADPGEVIATGNEVSETFTLTMQHELAAGEHWFWLSPILKNTASIDATIDASVFRVKVGDEILTPSHPSPGEPQRIGYAVRLPGDDGSVSYRIPGLARSNAGTLIAVYDIRHRHAGDLPADIDVGVSRSTDGGQSWEPMIVAMNMGNDPQHGYDGIGDPSILVDPANGRIWIAALWSHGNNGWNGSGPGMTPEETGQFMLAHSDDDGKTWSDPINVTSQMKDPAWRLFFNGPGAGIVLADGTLVFPAQFRAADGVPWSTIIHSQDQGESWQVGTGVKSNTTEAQVVQLADGSIMINCRDNRGGSRTVATTMDLGKTWQLHPSDRSALREPVCMASLLRWEHPAHGDLIFFSNPDTTSGRYNMTLKVSRDQGLTWPDHDARLYDSRACFGYSCLAIAGPDHIGVLYEGRSSMLFLRFPLAEWDE